MFSIMFNIIPNETKMFLSGWASGTPHTEHRAYREEVVRVGDELRLHVRVYRSGVQTSSCLDVRSSPRPISIPALSVLHHLGRLTSRARMFARSGRNRSPPRGGRSPAQSLHSRPRRPHLRKLPITRNKSVRTTLRLGDRHRLPNVSAQNGARLRNTLLRREYPR